MGTSNGSSWLSTTKTDTLNTCSGTVFLCCVWGGDRAATSLPFLSKAKRKVMVVDGRDTGVAEYSRAVFESQITPHLTAEDLQEQDAIAAAPDDDVASKLVTDNADGLDTAGRRQPPV